MSASNGGRGTPPVPPEGHGPPRQVEIGKTILQQALGVEVERDGEGLVLSFIVPEAGEPIRRTFRVGKSGREKIRDAANGGVEIATADQVPGAPR